MYWKIALPLFKLHATPQLYGVWYLSESIVKLETLANAWNFESSELIVAFSRNKSTWLLRGAVHAVIAEVVTILECYFTTFPTSECIQGQESTLLHYASTVSDLRTVPFNKFLFLQEEGTLMPLQSSYERKSGTVCLSKGSERSAPGISAGESVASISSVEISNKSRCFSRTLGSIHLIRNSTCSLRSLVLH